MQLSEFLSSDLTYLLPAPGGAILNGSDKTSCDGDAYLAAVAAHIKEKGMGADTAVNFLYMKMGHIANQQHFGIEQDTLIIERLGIWIREFVTSH